MISNPYILNFNTISGPDINEIGGKALNLARCYKAGFNVPESIIISTKAHFLYLNGNDMDGLFQDINNCFSNDDIIIVRSSAVKEDLHAASFAGQYLSRICSNTTDSIKSACLECWDSLYSESAVQYSNRINTDNQSEEGMALLVQRLVRSSRSGVCFTADPADVEAGKYVVNAVYGLGETLVSGEVIADHYIIDKENRKQKSVITGKQREWREPFGGKLLPLPHDLIGKEVLSKGDINEIVDLARKIHEIYDCHMDLEWAYEDNILYLLQARPITAAKTSDYELWTRDNVADVIPDVVTPMTWSFVALPTNNGFKKTIQKIGLKTIDSSLFRIFEGRVYFNQTAYQGMISFSPREKGRYLLYVNIAVRYLWLFLTLNLSVKLSHLMFKARISHGKIKNDSEGLVFLKSLLDKYMKLHFKIAVMMEFGFIFIRNLIRNHIKAEEIDSLLNNVVTGLSRIESTVAGEELAELAMEIGRHHELRNEILNSPAASILSKLKSGDRQVAHMWDVFSKKFGYSSLKEFELYYPRWSEDPQFLINNLVRYLAQGNKIDYKKSQYIQKNKRISSIKKIISIVPCILRLPLKIYIKHVQNCSIWRESSKQQLVKIIAEIRYKCLGFAGRLKIGPQNNIFFLTLDEIQDINIEKNYELMINKIDGRKKEWLKNIRHVGYKEIRIYSNNRTDKIPYIPGDKKILKGLSLSNGRYQGVARVVKDPNKVEVFNHGDILVAPSTNPGWTPLFFLSGAIITDMGNYLSHGAIIARELGLPAVGNLYEATMRIKDGQIIVVDGDNGLVYLEEDNNYD